MDRRNFFKLTLSAGALTAVGADIAMAEWVPTRPINVIVPYDAGGGVDSFARAIAAASQGMFPVPLVIVNKPGASGITGAAEVSRARVDGSTILLTSAGSFLLTSMLRDTEVNPFDQFDVIAQVGDLTAAIMVPAESPYQTLADLVAELKAKPGSLRWAHSGNGSYIQIAGQGFLNANGLEAVGVPFKGGAELRTAIIGQQVDFGVLGVQQSTGFETTMRVLGVSSERPDPVLSQHPTISSQGFGFADVSSPIMAFAPKGTDIEIMSSLEAAIKTVMESPALAATMLQRGDAPVFLPGAEAAARLAKMRDVAAPIIAALK